ncbi:MAG: hypothetical protein DRP74_08790 [Candidatus Omnitrophota bacterium]|nr:MAG: hypothetical protein DRP74_08790 [Candidatus Omnitrophota bacterium]
MKKLNSIQIAKKLREKGVVLFSPLDFQRMFEASNFSARNFINRHISTGLFVKVRNGLYAFSENMPPRFLIANKLYSPSYISFETALSFYHIMPETIYTVFSATPKASRRFTSLSTDYAYHRIRRDLFFGYLAEKIESVTVMIAEPEKALLDYLYFVDLKKKTLSDRIDIKRVSKKTLLKYARAFKRKGLLVLISRIYDK